MTVYLGGTAFPTGDLWQGRLFVRTDIGEGLLCQYDLANTQWLTAATFETRDLSTIVSAVGTSYSIIRTDIDASGGGGTYEPWFVQYAINTNPAATNDGSKYWTVTLQSLDGIGGSATTVYTFDTSGDTQATYTERRGIPTTQDPSNNGYFGWNFAKTSTPGNLTFYAKCFYKLIIT